MKYRLTFTGGVIVGLLTAIRIIALDKDVLEAGKESLGKDEEEITQKEIQTDEGDDHDEDDMNPKDQNSVESSQKKTDSEKELPAIWLVAQHFI
ncbi:MAG: hypothetical protein C4518_08430 [Desulfobacteraceae bacterium]|nr:MAG: hypothetical protein C4518_08430 [Desulfobacteraceae bacterium]